MKKIIIALLVAVVLAGVTGGAIYAVGEHQPIAGHKLIGFGGRGTIDTITDNRYLRVISGAQFIVTNPACSKSITIERVQVMDQDGIVIFAEGPGTYGPFTDEIIDIPEELLPHQVWKFRLRDLISSTEPVAPYTVEIDWKGAADTPLIGRINNSFVGLKVTPNPPGPPTVEQHFLSSQAMPMWNLPLR